MAGLQVEQDSVDHLGHGVDDQDRDTGDDADRPRENGQPNLVCSDESAQPVRRVDHESSEPVPGPLPFRRVFPERRERAPRITSAVAPAAFGRHAAPVSP